MDGDEPGSESTFAASLTIFISLSISSRPDTDRAEAVSVVGNRNRLGDVLPLVGLEPDLSLHATTFGATIYPGGRGISTFSGRHMCRQ